MFSELTWLGTVLLGLGVLVVGALACWVIVRAARDRFGSRRRRRRSRRRRRRFLGR
jgi:hypothetical protein